jgi:hypothetical protein
MSETGTGQRVAQLHDGHMMMITTTTTTTAINNKANLYF